MFSTADLCDSYRDEISVLNTPLNSYGGVDIFSGEVVTLKLNRDNRALVEMLKREEGRGRVAVIDVDKAFYAVVGDTLMGYAHKNGWAGLVINGYVRDTKITRDIDVGLLAIGTCPRKSFEENSSYRDIPLNFGGIEFRSGDYIYVDSDGVVVSDKRLIGDGIE
ncbi:MAG: ribonuclease E activity regulator RraA [Epsilonproteobacteria bacterium]|jgi:regulator of ribonuclease activity A|nr:ribonuclease E activity regulator RraA [Campylobacterota bacterium]